MDSNILVCTDAVAQNFGIFDFSIAPDVLFYAYIPIAILSLIFGLIIGFNKRSDSTLTNILFLGLTVTFTVHILNELAQWVLVPAGLIYFGWSLAILLHSLIAIFILLFTITFAYGKPIRFRYSSLIALLLLPIVIFLPTDLNLVGFDLDWCGAESGPLWNYLYFIEGTTIVTLAFLFIRSLYQAKKPFDNEKKRELAVLLASFVMTLVFFGAEFLGSFTLLFEINFIGPVGMVVFLAIITYMIVKFSAFNIALSASRALVFALIIITGAQLTFKENVTDVFLTIFTIILAVVIGHFLLKSVQKEIEQRKELEKLTQELEKANERLKELDKLKSEFVSIASHQLRSPLTSIRGYASMLAEESFGKIPETAKEPLKRIEESARLMAMAVEDYLNVSRIEAGNMKYNLSDFNLKDETEKITDDIRPVAMEKGLVLLFRTDLNSRGLVNADIGKTVQIIHNLINNSMKYTPKGSITVHVRDDVQKKRIFVDISDTGIGINKENLAKLFQKFSRANNANSVNVSGTGLGLFVAQKMAQAMGGNISAHSEGDGKGSTFTLELPLVS